MLRSRILGAIGLALALGGPAPLRADLVTYTQARVSADHRGTDLFDEVATGVGSTSIGPLSGSKVVGGETYSATGYAATSTVGDAFMKLSATSSSTAAHALIGQVSSVASAAWRDVVTLSEAAGRPDAIRLRFTIEGSLEAERFRESGSYSAGLAGLGVTFHPGEALRTDDSESSTDVRFDDVFVRLYETRSGNLPGFNHQGLSGLSGGPAGFTATFDYDVAYDAGLGGYFWNMTVVADSFAGEGRSAALFGSTIKLTDVTSTDGASFAEGDYSFESGLRLTAGPAAVPEPGSLFLTACGVLGLGLSVRNRDRARSGAQA